jgi:putative ABC transport system substrate-binding protein
VTRVLAVLALIWASGGPPCADAQAVAKPQVGALFLGSEHADISQAGRAFREGLRELGWIEGQNLALSLKFANGDRERLAVLAGELVREKVDVIVAVGTVATQAARRETARIPIVMAGVGDPVGTGLVKNLGRPEANVTGVSLLNVELSGKRLELLKDVVPKLARVGVLYAEAPSSLASLKQIQAEAPRLGLEIRTSVFRDPQSVTDRIAEVRAAGAQALVVLPSPIVDETRAVIAEAATRHRLPTMCAFGEYVDAGSLMSYGSDFSVQQRRAARYVDLILKGARPAELPVEQPTHFELALNLRTARALGLTIPPSLLLRADRVIQ